MSQIRTAEEYQELGRRYYKFKQFAAAISAFTNGITVAPSVSLLDHRAACYDKLKDYGAAVKDGREMIKLDRRDVRGYLRTASVLEKMGKQETALGVYGYGLRNVEVGDRNFKILQQLHSTLTRTLSPARSIDPLTAVPPELAEMILSYLSFRQVVNCMRVSRGWCDYISKMSGLWLHLDLSGARKPVSRGFVNKAVRRSEYHLTRLTVHKFEHLDVVTNIAKCCKELAELEVLSMPYAVRESYIGIAAAAKNLQKLVIHADITKETICKIFQARPHLKHAAFMSVSEGTNADSFLTEPLPALESWTIQYSTTCRPPRRTFESHCLSFTPALTSLAVHDATLVPESTHTYPDWRHTALQNLSLTRIDFAALPLLPDSLQRLTIDFQGSCPPANYLPALLGSRLKALTHVSLAGLADLSAANFSHTLDLWLLNGTSGTASIIPDAAPLQSLTLHCALPQSITPYTLLSTSRRVLTPSLTHLDLAGLPIDDDAIESLLTHELTGLASLEFSRTRVSGAGIKMLVDGLPGLRRLGVDECPGVRGRGAVDYALGKGIRISCRSLGGEGRGGKKVRY